MMVKICVVGCLHGELSNMFNDIRETELKYGYKVDIVLCCGDFQAVRNESDLTVMSVPPKYRRLGDFWKYYSGELKSPYLTIFIGGNHEASNYLQELPYGGWVAENIYYLGYAGVINFCGLRIAGMSGIYKRHDYYTGHYEHAPYDDQSQRTAYHVRNIETFRMTQINSPIDIVLSHDWPRGIYNYSNQLPTLLKNKPYFEEEIKNNVFGSPAGEEILLHLKPRYWFAAHHHCKFTASIQYPDANKPITRFLALDKCLPRKHYLQILDVEPTNGNQSQDKFLSLDPEWLCILKATNHLMSITKAVNIMPTQINHERCDFSASKEDLKELSELFNNQFKIPNNFETTAPIHNEEYIEASNKPKPVEIFANPQTDLLCAMLDLVNPNGLFLGSRLSLDDISKKLRKCSSSSSSGSEGDSGSEEEDGKADMESKSGNPEEIDLEDEDEEGVEENVGEETNEYDPSDALITEDYPEEININGDEEEEVEKVDLTEDGEEEESGDIGDMEQYDPSDALITMDNPEEIVIDVEDEEERGDTGDIEQYDPTDYPIDNNGDSDKEDDGYCPMAPFL